MGRSLESGQAVPRRANNLRLQRFVRVLISSMKLEGVSPTKGECLRTAQEKIMEEIRCEMKPYSQDLRERVVKAVDEGLSRGEIVKLFGVSEATIKRYLKQRRETGNLAPKPIPGYPPRKVGALQKG